jgi:hypothetical protein
MPYRADLSVYPDRPTEAEHAWLSVGWLDSSHSFPQGDVIKPRAERAAPSHYDPDVANDHRRTLDDGREVVVAREGELGWAVWIDGQQDTSIVVGRPLAPTIADAIGYDVAHEEWPTWIDQWASEIEASETS